MVRAARRAVPFAVSGLRFLVGTDYVTTPSCRGCAHSGMAAMELHQNRTRYVVLSALFGLFSRSPSPFFSSSRFSPIAHHAGPARLLRMLLALLRVVHPDLSFYNTFNLVRQSVAMSIVFFAHRARWKENADLFSVRGLRRPFSRLGAVMIPCTSSCSVRLVAGHLSRLCRRTAVFPILRLGGKSALAVLSETRYSAYEEMMKNSRPHHYAACSRDRRARCCSPSVPASTRRGIPPPTWSAICACSLSCFLSIVKAIYLYTYFTLLQYLLPVLLPYLVCC